MQHTFADRDIFFNVRSSDYSHDVYVGDDWMASATCFHTGELVADEVCGRLLLGRPAVVADTNLLNSDQAPEPCRACGGEHHVQRCPEIKALLFASVEPAVLLAFERLVQLRPHQEAA